MPENPGSPGRLEAMAWVPAWHEHCGRVTVAASSTLLGYLLLSATNPCSVRAAVVGPATGVGAGDRWPLRQPGGDPCRLARQARPLVPRSGLQPRCYFRTSPLCFRL